MNDYSSSVRDKIIAAAAVACFLGGVVAQDGQVLSGPAGVNTSLGSLAEFHCSGEGILVVWLVNETSTFNIDSPWISTIQSDKDDGTISAVLAINATHGTNNTEIQCYVHDFDSNSLVTPVVVLLVQGLLGPVQGVKTTITKTSVLISWNGPYTLAGVPIISYEVVVELQTGAILRDDTIPGTSLTIPVSELNGCDVIRTVISANNEVGKGESHSLTTPYPGVPGKVDNITVAVSVSAGGPSVQFSFQTETLCLDQWLSLRLMVQSAASTIGPFPLDNTIDFPCGLSSATITGLAVDSWWEVRLWLENDAGVGAMSDYVAFSTFPIQSADIADMSNGIVCVWCYFAEGSPTANGCTFHIPSCAGYPNAHSTFKVVRDDLDSTKALACYINDCCSCDLNCTAFVYGSLHPSGEDKPAVIMNNISLSCYADPILGTDENTASSASPNNGQGTDTLTSMATTATTRLPTAAVPAQEVLMSAQDIFLYIMLPGTVLVIVIFTGLISLLAILVLHRKQSTAGIESKEMEVGLKVKDNPCYEGIGSYTQDPTIMARNPIYDELNISI